MRVFVTIFCFSALVTGTVKLCKQICKDSALFKSQVLNSILQANSKSFRITPKQPS